MQNDFSKNIKGLKFMKKILEKDENKETPTISALLYSKNPVLEFNGNNNKSQDNEHDNLLKKRKL